MLIFNNVFLSTDFGPKTKVCRKIKLNTKHAWVAQGSRRCALLERCFSKQTKGKGGNVRIDSKQFSLGSANYFPWFFTSFSSVSFRSPIFHHLADLVWLNYDRQESPHWLTLCREGWRLSEWRSVLIESSQKSTLTLPHTHLASPPRSMIIK